MAESHYLKDELYALVRNDSTIFEFLQSGSLDGLWYWDLENPEHEWMNPRFWEILGFDPNKKQHRAAEWQDLIHPDDLTTAVENFEKHCADPSHPYDQIVRYRHKDGSTVWVRCRGMAIRDEQGKPIRMLGAHNDVTELQLVQEALIDRAEELRLSNAELEDFAYKASHDLRAPLRGISNLASFLEEDIAKIIPEESLHHLRLIRDRVNKMDALLSDLLQYSRVGRLHGDYRDFDTRRVVTEIFDTLSLSTEMKFDVCGELPIFETYASPLGLCLRCLITNAVWHHDRIDGHVEVRCEDEGEFYHFSVIDDGPGIDPKHHDRIFMMFQSLQPIATTKGSGMGLAIVKRAVACYGGAIAVDSELGKGARFDLRWPKEISLDTETDVA